MLEAAFATLLPNVDLNGVLNGASYDAPDHNTPGSVAASEAVSLVRVNLRDSTSPAPDEALPKQADGFDWAEETTLSGLSDGMAALSIKPEGTGYLGEGFEIFKGKALADNSIHLKVPLRA